MRSLWPHGGLWRHPDFLKLWSAETISQFGTQVSNLAIPLVAILVLDASAFEVATLGTVLFLPFIIFTLPAGVWVDRMRRKPILVAGDLGRAVLLATIPLAYVADALTLAQLYAVGFLVGVCTVFFDVAYQSYLPALVEREQLVEGNSKLEISRSASQIAGPGLGGGLIQALTAPYAVLVDAASFLGSGLFILRIRKVEERPGHEQHPAHERASLWTDTKEGLRFVLGNPHLRAQAGCTGTSNFFFSLAFSIILVYFVRELDLSPGAIGVILSIGSIGALVAAVTVNRISARVGVGRTAIAASFLEGPAVLLILLAPVESPIPFLVVAQLLLSFAMVTYNVMVVSFRQALCPERMQGRMNSVMRFIVWGTIPLGNLAGGAIATTYSLRTAILVGAIGGGLAFLWLLLSPMRNVREIPTEPMVFGPPEPAPA